MWMYIAALLISAKTWKQLVVDKWINKLWYVETIGLFSTNQEMSYQVM